eukprot:TRINITY_DN10449_c0_g1_i1.p1 TRINITY_DN10449_c0_g1~~TRINITY_DN10449_c0_g1_i1.p1  ORF type:complete len:379 (-),score=48.84 TRINITY_DN10449_c0_g1_i1:70-1044(-)
MTNASQTVASSNQAAIIDASSTLDYSCYPNDYNSDACCERPDYGHACKSHFFTGNELLFYGGERQCVIYDAILDCLSVSSELEAGVQFSASDKESCLANMFADPTSMSKEDVAACCAGATAAGIAGWRVNQKLALQKGRRWAAAAMLGPVLGDINLELHSAQLATAAQSLTSVLNARGLWNWMAGRQPQDPHFSEVMYVGMVVSLVREFASKDLSFAVNLQAYLKTSVKVAGGIVAIAGLVGTTIVTFGGTAPAVPAAVAAGIAFLSTINAADSVKDATQELKNVDRLYDEVYCQNEKPAPRSSLLDGTSPYVKVLPLGWNNSL